MLKRVLTAIIGFAITTSSSALELSKYPKAFAAPFGVEVIVAHTADGDQALMQVNGVEHKMDGVVFLSDIVSRGGDTRAYQYTRNGKERALVLRQEGWRGEYFEAFLPDQGRVALQPDVERAEAIDTRALIALYQQQKNEGVQDQIAEFDREGRLDGIKESLASMDEEASEQCDTPLNTHIDWASISDDHLLSLSIESYCGSVASELGQLCESDKQFREVAQGIDRIDCQFGDRLKLDKTNRSVIFTTAKDEPNQQEFIRNYFRNL